jgi:hypothetical protein
VRPSGAASHLDLFEQPAGFSRILLVAPAGVIVMGLWRILASR